MMCYDMKWPDVMYVMSCHDMSCHVMSCHVMSCHVMSFPAMPCHAMPCHTMSYHSMLCHVMLCHVVSCCVILCHTMPCCCMPYHAVSCHVTLCHAVLCCTMPCHAVSCHVMSCHVMSCHVMSCQVMSYHEIMINDNYSVMFWHHVVLKNLILMIWTITLLTTKPNFSSFYFMFLVKLVFLFAPQYIHNFVCLILTAQCIEVFLYFILLRVVTIFFMDIGDIIEPLLHFLFFLGGLVSFVF